MKRKPLLLAAFISLSLPLIASADNYTPEELALKYRKSQMTLTGANMSPMAAMVKGKIPWDSAAISAYSKDLSAVASLNPMRGYIPGSQGGKTKAKPEIWDNLEDFSEKSDDFAEASANLAATSPDDKDAFLKAFKSLGETCKACHKEYKSKEYLNQ